MKGPSGRPPAERTDSTRTLDAEDAKSEQATSHAAIEADSVAELEQLPGYSGWKRSTAKDPMIGARFGSYVLRRRLGEGGFGTVFLAERVEGYEQKVAVKTIRIDRLAESRVLYRFELERQALADLRHENIAQLLDGGTTEQGQPYLVMEYVEGLAITEYCDTKGMSIRDRLALFIKVAKAVAHAHDFGYIHRDIKPSNILVRRDGVPKLLDFGIAKLVDERSKSRNVSLTGERLPLTPEYASPEQIRGDRLETTKSTDVYSLGAVLHELLTGSRPFQGHRGDLRDLEKAICESDLEPASLIALRPRKENSGGTGETATAEEISANRSTTPRRLSWMLRGDLETILMMALRKERQRRYESPIALAKDIECFLAGKTIAARRDSISYRTRKFVAAHAVAVAVVSLVMVILTAATLISVQFAVLANRSAQNAEMVAGEERIARQEAEAIAGTLLHEGLRSLTDNFVPSAQASLEEWEKAIQTEGLVGHLNPKALHFAQTRPAVAEGRMRVGMSLCKKQLPDNECVHDVFRNAIAVCDLHLERFDEAIETLKKLIAKYQDRPVEGGTPELLATLHFNLAEAYRLTRQPHLGMNQYRKSLRIGKRHLGDRHRHLPAIGQMACLLEIGRIEEAKQLANSLHESLDSDEIEVWDHYAASLRQISSVYQQSGKLQESITVLGVARKLPCEETQARRILSDLANAENALGHFTVAESVIREWIDRQNESSGPNRPSDEEVECATIGLAESLFGQESYAQCLDVLQSQNERWNHLPNGLRLGSDPTERSRAKILFVASLIHLGRPFDADHLGSGLRWFTRLREIHPEKRWYIARAFERLEEAFRKSRLDLELHRTQSSWRQVATQLDTVQDRITRSGAVALRKDMETTGLPSLGQFVDRAPHLLGEGGIRNYENGVIVVHRYGGAHGILATVFDVWDRMGRKNSPLGHPISTTCYRPDRQWTRTDFFGGVIYWRPGCDAFPVTGAIDRWLHNVSSREEYLLGYPTDFANQEASGDTSQTFQFGAIHVDGGGEIEVRAPRLTDILHQLEEKFDTKVVQHECDSCRVFARTSDQRVFMSEPAKADGTTEDVVSWSLIASDIESMSPRFPCVAKGEFLELSRAGRTFRYKPDSSAAKTR